MRWKKPSKGDIKIKRKFALLPIEINKDVRWLEWVNIKYVYHEGSKFYFPNDYKTYVFYGWKKENFVD